MFEERNLQVSGLNKSGTDDPELYFPFFFKEKPSAQEGGGGGGGGVLHEVHRSQESSVNYNRNFRMFQESSHHFSETHSPTPTHILRFTQLQLN